MDNNVEILTRKAIDFFKKEDDNGKFSLPESITFKQANVIAERVRKAVFSRYYGYVKIDTIRNKPFLVYHHDSSTD